MALRWILQRGVPLVLQHVDATQMIEDLEPLFQFSLSEAEINGIGEYREGTGALRKPRMFGYFPGFLSYF